MKTYLLPNSNIFNLYNFVALSIYEIKGEWKMNIQLSGASDIGCDFATEQEAKLHSDLIKNELNKLS